MGDPSSLLIREIQGERHKLELVGRALPYRPMSFEGSMRAEFTWYPGNPIATVQMLGAQEAPTTINGMWKDRFIKTTSNLGIPILGQTGKAYYDDAIIDNVSDLVKLADGFRRRGSLVEVAWDDIVRQGILTKFKQTWLRTEDVEWEMEFTWMSQGEDELPVVFNVLSSLADMINSIVDAVNALVEAIAELKAEFAAIASWVNAINNIIDGIVAAVSGLVDLAKQAAKLVVAPYAIIGNMVAACQTIGDQCKELVKTIENIPARMARAVGFDPVTSSSVTVDDTGGDTEPAPGTNPNDESQDEVLAAESAMRKAKRAARKLKAEVARRQQEMISQTQDQTKPLATFIARDGMDLRDVSTQYYGTPGEWIRLMLYNGFNTSRLLAGDMVIVPQLSGIGQPAPASTLKAP